MECPHCQRRIFSVPCPQCGRKTLNLTQIARYGKVSCFACQTSIDHLPDREAAQPAKPATATAVATPAAAIITQRSTVGVMSRAPKLPAMPSVSEARRVLEECLHGLERAVQDREMLCAPELYTVAIRFLEAAQDVLALDDQMSRGEVTGEWLREKGQFHRVARLCYIPLWPLEGAFLPPAVQAWAMVVDDALRRWQYARRQWLTETCGLTMMAIVPDVTATNTAWHEIAGNGSVVHEVIAPGFTLNGEVICKARVRS